MSFIPSLGAEGLVWNVGGEVPYENGGIGRREGEPPYNSKKCDEYFYAQILSINKIQKFQTFSELFEEKNMQQCFFHDFKYLTNYLTNLKKKIFYHEIF